MQAVQRWLAERGIQLLPLPAPLVCHETPPQLPEDSGFLQGIAFTISAVHPFVRGWEAVFDLYDFEAGAFSFVTQQGGWASDIGIGGTMYRGTVTGWSNFRGDRRGVKAYSGTSLWTQSTLNFPFVKIAAESWATFHSEDYSLTGKYRGENIGLGANPLSSVMKGVSFYTLIAEPYIFRHDKMNPPRATDADAFIRYLEGTDVDTADKYWMIQKVRINGERWEHVYQQLHSW